MVVVANYYVLENLLDDALFGILSFFRHFVSLLDLLHVLVKVLRLISVRA